ncbi:MAG: putative O-glycosylation ligase, exosortase A system-associated [Gammaproteobacteria bacterium]|nr:putative O-glycosylation ligase, exosortase A system-associated [Gammaproteobacteria bacterium]
MRDILVTLLIFGSIPFILKRPHIGVLVWSWIGYMNPHRLTFGFAYNFPFAALIGIVTVISMVVSKDTRLFPKHPATIILIIFIIWMGITCTQAMYPDVAWDSYKRVIKIQMMIFITMMLLQSRERIQQLIWVIVGSIGFYGIKGGIFTIATKGQFMVLGPSDGFFTGNTEIGLIILMTLPLMYYLHQTTENRWIQHGLVLGMLLMAIAAIGTHSRGALVAALAVSGFFWMKSNTKILTGTAGIILLTTLYYFMPPAWHEKMMTTIHYQQDASAMGRINAWKAGLNVAKDRFFGGGFDFWTPDSFLIYAPNPKDFHDAHSIYFEVLGEHGYIGLGLFMLYGVIAFITASNIIRRTQKIDYFAWANLLARMIQVALIAYATGGAFLGLAYADIGYQLVAVLILLQYLVKQGVPEQEQNADNENFSAEEPKSFIKKPMSVKPASTSFVKRDPSRHAR